MGRLLHGREFGGTWRHVLDTAVRFHAESGGIVEVELDGCRVHVVHLRPAWAMTELGKEPRDGVARALRLNLDRTIGAVAHPSGQIQTSRRGAGEVAVSDSLHEAGYPDMEANLVRWVSHPIASDPSYAHLCR